MKNIFFALLFTFAAAGAAAQEEPVFSVALSTVSLLLGNYLQVKFTLANAQGENFAEPPFNGFRIVSGPNYASSFSMMNGQVSQSISYTFFLDPLEVGNYYIEPASIRVDGKVLETTPLEVLVVPNPDGTIQQPETGAQRFEFRFDDFGFSPLPDSIPPAQPSKHKKKRKIYTAKRTSEIKVAITPIHCCCANLSLRIVQANNTVTAG